MPGVPAFTDAWGLTAFAPQVLSWLHDINTKTDGLLDIIFTIMVLGFAVTALFGYLWGKR